MARQCGDCQLCCRLVPVQEIGKPANTACRHQWPAGCFIYQRRPRSCREWSCQWLTNERGTADMQRPDITHYVIDPLPNYITRSDDGSRWLVAQVWVDDQYPEAHTDPALRAFLDSHSVIGLIRWDNKRGMLLIPPSVNADRVWIEQRDGLERGAEQDPAEVMAMQMRGELK